jgi:hypothetical protein
MTKVSLLAVVACLSSLMACSSSSSTDENSPDTGVPLPGDSCPNLAGTYNVTTQVISTTCKLGLNVITQPITYVFTQAAPSCAFTMTNSVYPGSVYTGHFTMAGSNAQVTWDSVAPTPTSAGYALTYTAESLTIVPGPTPETSALFGTFAWHSGAACDGTTNVCSGSVPAGCPTPQ